MQFPRNVLIATAASLLTDISSEMIVYVLPIFLSGVLQTPMALIGLIEGVAETTASFTKLASGYLSDRLKNRKIPVVFGYTLSTIVKAFLVFVTSWQGVFAIRTIDRLGKGLRTAPRDALIADSVDETQRGAAFGFHRAGDTLGAFIGVGLALLIILWSSQTSLSAQTFRTLVLVSMIPATLAVILLIFGLKEPKRTKEVTTIATLSIPFKQNFKVFLGIVALFSLGNSADAFIVLLAKERGASLVIILAMVLSFNLVYTLAAQPLGKLSDQIGRQKLIIAGWLVYAAVYLGLAFSNQVWQVWILWAFYGLYYALSEGAIKALIADVVDKEQRGTAYGWLNAVVGFMALPASFLAGILWQNLTPMAPFLFGACTAILSLFGLIAFTSLHKTSVINH